MTGYFKLKNGNKTLTKTSINLFMNNIKYYLKDEVLDGQADIEFKENSVILIRNLFEKTFLQRGC